ncbi:hypothetical protein ACONUD_15915 [Microbulbifer harenosus]|uniref:Carboxymuconolactone decarboxylase-like domain-containing protein n=1 Tax=Microbulbifer harenosus TaxID=2576840 RepID=A0ABY2UEW3_9GAMM|nr:MULTISPECIES: hypothetical protein [Microbulbifer]QIL90678.1 hypothetical protein GNX18_13590 [Microbulbifer sp. SH-1]TLM75706.1 hypothetical protein FDY93_15545 [Microbulbifer harenosus]
MDDKTAQQQLAEFGEYYRYDVGYLQDFLQLAPKGYEAFQGFQPLSLYRDQLPLDIYWVSRLASMQIADCGECLQLTVRMALEAGLDKNLVKACIEGGSRLPESLKDVYDFASAVASYRAIDPQLDARIDQQLDKAQRIELGICVATAAVYPTIKRALGIAQRCSLVEIEYAA